MSDNPGIKPLVPPEMVLPLLQDYFGGAIQHLQRVSGGHVAQTFSFTVEGGPGSDNAAAREPRAYMVRFNPPMLVNFEKEAYVYANFASPALPIPRVLHLGRLGAVHFAIAEKAPGQDLLRLPRSEYLALIPEQIRLLDAIHQIPLDDRPGYGIFDGAGVAHWPSWQAHLEFAQEEEPAGDFYGNWHALFATSFLERELFEHLYRRMMLLAAYCPEERYLVHGNYGFGNVLAQDGKITAILDWMNACYGDFLYDIAWLDFWSPADGWPERFAEHYGRLGRTTPHYSERIRCYHCSIALDALKFNAKGGDRAGYEWVRVRILSLLAAA